MGVNCPPMLRPVRKCSVKMVRVLGSPENVELIIKSDEEMYNICIIYHRSIQSIVCYAEYSIVALDISECRFKRHSNSFIVTTLNS